jgi:hypothetical protein
MRTNRRTALLGCAALIWVVGIVPGAAQETTPKAKKGPAAIQSLIRLDLLQVEVPSLEPPLRNIFAPHRGGARPSGPGDAVRPGSDDPEGGSEGTDPRPDEKEQPMDKPAANVMTLRYVGFVSSAERTVGVVIYQGEVLAVKPGELIAEGVTILKITPEEIVYQGPDAVSRTVSLEGEDR